MIEILSTRILSPEQREILEKHGISLKEYNAIDISFRKFPLDLEMDHYIFTSQNAVRSFLRALENLPLPEKRVEAQSKNCYCVGHKTAALLIENGMKVSKTAHNSRELAEYIVQRNPSDSYLFICGNLRRKELPDILNKYTVRYSEVVAYDTSIIQRVFDMKFDGVLFYSPSGVESFVTANDLSESTAFCIGTSTEQQALQYTTSTIVALEQRIESVLEACVNYFYPNP